MAKNSEKIYFTSIIAMLIVIAVAVASLIYALIVGGEKERLEEVLIEEVNGVPYVNPGRNMHYPVGEPDIDQPTNPPPA